jgi:inhibitor of the pro-sigma K processing machinery
MTLEPIVVITVLGIFVFLLLFLGAPVKPIRFIGQGVIKVVIGAFLLFFLNVLGNQFGVHVPINLITSAISGLLGIPGLCALVAIEMWIM